MKTYIASFSKFNRIYESIENPEEEVRLSKLFKESTEYLMAEIDAGTADGFTFYKWIDTVCDIIDSTETKGLIIEETKQFILKNISKLFPLMSQKNLGGLDPRKAASLKARFAALAKGDQVKKKNAEELMKKYGLL